MEPGESNSTEVESVGSNQDNVSRTSSSFDEQSESSGESDNDGEPDIDQMLSELEGFQVELVQTDSHAFEQEEELPESNEPLDEISFSLNAIEDSGDIDLDALLEDLCSMEKDLISSVTEEAKARSPSPSKHSPRRLSSPVKVSADVKWKLGALEEQLENQELTFEQQQAKFKEEKIRIAMEKLREARVKKLVIKVFNDEDPTSKTILVDQTWTAWDVCKKMIKKYDREASTNWLLEERQPANQLVRVLEDHECIVDIVSQWPRETSNQLVFTLRRDKYVLFKNPQNYLLSSDTSEGSARLAEQSKDTLISEFFKPDAMRLPNLDGVLYLKEGKKSWKKHYFLLRASGVYYTPKGKTKNQRNLSCLVSFDQTYVYTTNDFKKTQKAPTEHCFVIKPSVAKDIDSRQVKCLCAPDGQTMQRWVTCIRVGKFGYKMLENKNNAFEEVEDLTVGDVKRTRTMSSSSSSSSDMGSINQQEIATRVRNRSDATEYNTYKKSHSLKAQPEKTTRTIGKLFQDAWKKGAVDDEVVSTPISPPTPFSPPRSSQTPTSGPKSFFVENEKLRNLDDIKEEKDGFPVVKHDPPLVLDPAPAPRKSFSNQGNQNSTTQKEEPDCPKSPPAVLPKQGLPSPDSLPPPPPPPPPHSLQLNTNQRSQDEVIEDSQYTCENRDSLPLPPTPDRPDTPNSSDELPLPPPPVSPPPVCPKPKSGSPEKFEGGPSQIPSSPPPLVSVNGHLKGAPPPPPPPPPLPRQAVDLSTKM